MNRPKASAWFIFVVLFIGIVFSPKVATVRVQFEEGTFSATEGESFAWKCNESKVEYYSTGDLINVSLGREKAGTHGGLPCKVIRFSEWVRNASGKWTRTANDAVFMARNGSEGYLEAHPEFYLGYVFVAPTPVNLTLLADEITEKGIYEATGGNGSLTLKGDADKVVVNLNEEGVMESLVATVEGVVVLRWVLVQEEPPQEADTEGGGLLFDPVAFLVVVSLVGLAGLGTFGLYKAITRQSHSATSEGSFLKVARTKSKKEKKLKHDPKRPTQGTPRVTVREYTLLDKERLRERFQEIVDEVMGLHAEFSEKKGTHVPARALKKELHGELEERFVSFSKEERRAIKREFKQFLKECLP